MHREVVETLKTSKVKAQSKKYLALAVLLWAGTAPVRLSAVFAQPSPIPVRVDEIRMRSLSEEISFVATLEPNVSTTVGAVVAGRVTASDPREGDKVVAGKTKLIQLDRSSREIALREAAAVVEKNWQKWQELKRGYRPEEIAQRRAEFDEQKAIADRAEKDWQRAEQLYRDQFISLAERDRLKSELVAAREKQNRLRAALNMAEQGPRKEEIAQAEAEYREAEARRDLLAYDLSRTAVAAPINGYVVKKHVEVGSWVIAGDPLMDIVDLNPIYATGPVGERRIAMLEAGMAATASLDAFPGRVFKGKVSHIVPQADIRSRTFPVKVGLPNANGQLKSGMLARVTIRVPAQQPSLVVPKDAILRQGQEEIVFTVDGDVARSHKVRSGRIMDGVVEVIQDSLRPGQKVVVLGNELLKDQAKVRVVAPGDGDQRAKGR